MKATICFFTCVTIIAITSNLPKLYFRNVKNFAINNDGRQHNISKYMITYNTLLYIEHLD